MRRATVGIVVVTYDSEDEIPACLEAVFSSDHDDFKVVVVDNASMDATPDAVRAWAAGEREAEIPAPARHPARREVPRPVPLGEMTGAEARAAGPGALGRLTLVRAEANLGFAGGVNLGLEALRGDGAAEIFWLLNPDGLPAPQALGAFAEAAARQPEFGLMSGRIVYCEPEGRIQNDGGRVDRLTGICRPLNLGLTPERAAAPDPATLDYVSGASLVASRRFLEAAGLMQEDYFLYYEEVDWAARRGALPILYVPEAVVHHHSGASIGTARLDRLASPFSNYFTYRNRMRFMRRFRPWALPAAYLYSLAKVGRLLTLGAVPEAAAAARGLHGMAPPAAVRDRVGPAAAALAFGRPRG